MAMKVAGWLVKLGIFLHQINVHFLETLDNRKPGNGINTNKTENKNTDDNCNPEDKENQTPNNVNNSQSEQTNRQTAEESKQVIKKEEESKSSWPK